MWSTTMPSMGPLAETSWSASRAIGKLLLSCGGLVPSMSVEEFGDGTHEVGGGRFGRDAAMEDGLIRDVGAIVGSSVVHVLVDHVTREVDASEDPFVA
jgi:hypothetical protein